MDAAVREGRLEPDEPTVEEASQVGMFDDNERNLWEWNDDIARGRPA